MFKLFSFLSLFFAQSFLTFADNTVIPATGELAPKFQEGTLQLYDIPIYISYLTDKLVWVAGVLAVIFVMIGGYQYLIGAYDDSTDDGKNTLKNVAIGLSLVLLSWIIIDIAIRLITE